MAARAREVPIPAKTKLIKPRELFTDELQDRIAKGKELQERKIDSIEQLSQLKKEYNNWDDFNEELLKQSFNNPQSEYYKNYSEVNRMVGMDDVLRRVDIDAPSYQLKQTKKYIENSLIVLERLVTKLPLIEQDVSGKSFQVKERLFYNRCFIVHGHDTTKKLEVTRFIEKDLKRQAIILHELPNQGRTIIEKFERHSEVDFAVALWTADDIGKGKDEGELQKRARQNVIFETGFFIGKLGRGNVIVLVEEGIEIPSDYSGVIFIRYSDNWKDDLRKEVDTSYKVSV